jgi:hypothetical protein
LFLAQIQLPTQLTWGEYPHGIVGGYRQDGGMTWTAPEVTRRAEFVPAGEREMLDTMLGYQRDTLVMKCAGLDAAALRTRSVPPSTLSLLGLIRHSALCERWWFRIQIGGADLPWLYVSDDNQDGEFDDVDDADPAVDFATYAEEVEACDAELAKHDLDDVFIAKARAGKELTVRWAYLHMIDEYARHIGHADLLRQSIDGATGY